MASNDKAMGEARPEQFPAEPISAQSGSQEGLSPSDANYRASTHVLSSDDEEDEEIAAGSRREATATTTATSAL